MKNFLILGGLYLVIGLPIDLLLLIFIYMSSVFTGVDAFYLLGMFLAYSELALLVWFLVLFFRLLFKSVPRIVSSVQKEHPQFSVYLEYLGYASYFGLIFTLVYAVLSQLIANEDVLDGMGYTWLAVWIIMIIWGLLTAWKLCRSQK